MDKLELFTNLMMLAASDGKFTEEEVDFLMIRAEKWGIEPEEVDAILAATHEGEGELTIPEGRDDRVLLLQEMIHLMAVDGELAEVEKRICATASAAMDFSPAEFNRVVDSLVGDE